VLSTDRSLFKGEAPRFSADLVYPLSSERPFKFPEYIYRLGCFDFALILKVVLKVF
jgi:hypothetical protein